MGIITDYGVHGSEAGLTAKERLFKADGTKRGFIYSHALGDLGIEFAYSPNGNYPFRRIVESGYPAVAMNMGGIATFGSSTYTGMMGNAITQINNLGAKTDKYIFVATSMGTIGTLNAISTGVVAKTKVAAIILCVPLFFLQRIHDSNRAGIATAVEVGYGGSSAGFAAAMPTYDPGQNTSAFSGIPMRIYVGDQDNLAYASEAHEFASKVGGSLIGVSTLGGKDHVTTTPSIDPNDLMAFSTTFL